MSGMADEMARRIAEDGGIPAGVAPGTEGAVPPPGQTPPAGALNTDTSESGGAPDTIPYPRFKEVNDSYQRLKPYEELESYGYDADSLRRLAAFEANYLNNPVETWVAIAENLDLPQPVMDAIKQHVTDAAAAAGSDGGSAEGETPSGGQSPQVQLSEEDRQRLEYIDSIRAREAEAERQAQLDGVMSAWNRMDERDGIKTPDRIKLVHIAEAARSGQQFTTYDALADAARASVLEYRSAVLGDAVQQTGRGASSPPSLPGGTPAASPPVKFASLREASRAAEAAISRGELPSIQP
jgi:hypothetical protein